MIWIALGLAVLTFAIWVWWTTRPISESLHEVGGVGRALDFLWTRGAKHASLKIYLPSERSPVLEFQKYIRSGSTGDLEVGLVSKIPAESVSSQLVQELRLDQQRFGRGVAGYRAKPLTIDCGRDLARAAAIADLILANSKNPNSHASAIVRFSLVSKVDAPHLTGVEGEQSDPPVRP